MKISRRTFGLAACWLAAITVLSPRPALAQVADDVTATKLAKARQDYESALQGLRADVEKTLDDKIDSKERKPKIRKAKEQSDDFEARGELPAGKEFDKFKKRYSDIAKTMKDAYTEAAAAYRSASKVDLAKAVSEELEQFESQWDLGPWRNNLLEGKSETQRTIKPDGETLRVSTDLKGEYRLEIKAKRNAKDGTLEIQFPLANGKELKLPAMVDSDGNLSVLLTLSEKLVSPELGIGDRPIKTAKATSGGAGKVAFYPKGGSFVLESLRVKPVVKGSAKEGIAKVEAKDPWTKGSKWVGHDDRTKWEIVVFERKDDTVTLKVTDNTDWEFKTKGTVQGERFVPISDGVEQTSGVRGHRRDLRKIMGQAGMVDGVFAVDFEITWDGKERRGPKNQVMRVRIPNAKPEN